MPLPERAPTGPRGTRGRPRLRTYVLLAVGDAAGVTEFARPLGTLVATTRTRARAAARALHADVDPGDLRAVAAGSAPPGYLARALALDGERLLRGGYDRAGTAFEGAA
ncbi:hypothetical protein tb265_14740 [Gemmatimonadetes bacterium T265]|nr:hypothetical protein tb265_14740 [Gemmatimonadetes bacterium T265]